MGLARLCQKLYGSTHKRKLVIDVIVRIGRLTLVQFHSEQSETDQQGLFQEPEKEHSRLVDSDV